MTPRSKRYFARRQSRKYGESIFAKLMPVFEAIEMAKAAYMRLTAPIPRYTSGTHPGGSAILGGGPGPERIFPRFDLPAGTRVFPEALIKEGIFDVKIANAFTPNARMTAKRVEP